MGNGRHWVSDEASIWCAVDFCVLAHTLVSLKHVFTPANLGFILHINKLLGYICIICSYKHGKWSKKDSCSCIRSGIRNCRYAKFHNQVIGVPSITPLSVSTPFLYINV